MLDNIPRAGLNSGEDPSRGDKSGIDIAASNRAPSARDSSPADPRDPRENAAGIASASNDASGVRPDPLLDAVWAQLPPGTSREKAEEVKVAARVGGIDRPDQLHSIAFKDGDTNAYVRGNVPGFRAVADLSTPAPPLEATRQREQTHERDQTQRSEQFAQEQTRVSEVGRSMSHGGRGTPLASPVAS